MTEQLLTNNQLPDHIIPFGGQLVNLDYQSAGQNLTLQMSIAMQTMRAIDGGQSSLVDELSSICKLTERLADSGADFVDGLRAHKDQYQDLLGSLINRASAADPSSRERIHYNAIMLAMGFEPSELSLGTKSKPMAVVATEQTRRHENTAGKVHALSSDSDTPGRTGRRVTSASILAATAAGIIASAAPAAAAPVHLRPAAQIITKLPGTPATPQAESTAAPVNTTNTTESNGTAATPASSTEASVPAGTTSATATPAAEAPVTTTTGTAPAASETSGTVQIGTDGTAPTTAPNTAPPTATNTPEAAGDSKTSPNTVTDTGDTTNPAPGGAVSVSQETPVSQPPAATISSPGSSESDTVPSSSITVEASVPVGANTVSVNTPSSEAQPPATPSDELASLMKTDTSSAQVAEDYINYLKQQNGWTPMPDSPYQQAVDNFVSQIDTASPGTPNAHAVSAKVEAYLPQAYSLTPPPPQNNTPYTTEIQAQLTDPSQGTLAGLAGQNNYPDTVQTDIPQSIAEAVTDITPQSEQDQNLAQLNQSTTGTNVTAATPPPPPPPTPEPAPAPAAPSSNPNQAPKAPAVLTDRQLAINAAKAMVQQGGLIGRQGEVTLYFLQNTDWSINGIIGGPIGNGTEESEGMNPTRSQATQSDVPASQILAQGIALGWGYWQSDPPTKVIQWCLNNNLNPDTIEGQGAWLINAVNNTPQLKAKLRQSDISVGDAADIFEQLFERAGNPALAAREQDARDAMTAFNAQLTPLKNKQNEAIANYKKAKKAWDAVQAKKAAHEKAVADAQAKIAQEAKAILDTSTYQNVLAQQEQAHPGFNAADFNNGADCAVAVAAAVSAVDQTMPVSGTVPQYNYMSNSSHWQRVKNIGNTSDLKPGDVFSIGRGSGWGAGGHTFVYLGGGKIMAASMGDHGPEQENVYFHDDRNNQFGNSGNNIDIFRYVG